MSGLFELIDMWFGMVLGIPYASALIVGALVCVVVGAFGVGFRFGRRK